MDRQMSDRETDAELQAQEILCLSSLLSPEEFHQTTESGGELFIHPVSDHSIELMVVPSGHLESVYRDLEMAVQQFAGFSSLAQCVEAIQDLITSMTSDGRAEGSASVEFLPPIELRFWYPDGYPSRSPPNVKLFCPWLRQDVLDRMESYIGELWEKHAGLAVLYDVFDHFRSCLAECRLFPLGSVLLLVANSDLPSLGQSPANVFCCRQPKRAMETLKLYSDARKESLFSQTIHQCPVCLSNRPGKDFIRLGNCQHQCCRECFRETCRVHVAEGTINLIRCLVCDAEVNPNDVEVVMPAEDFEKYQRLQLSQALDCMEDVVYCPRATCNAPVIRDDLTSSVALCGCGYAFCTRCRASSHGVIPCRSSAMKIADLESKAAANDDKIYIKARLLEMIEEAKNEVWLEAFSKNCPRCWASVQKNGGCNHMTCPRCQVHWCWLCLTVLDMKSPYNHFNDPNGACNQQLWNGEENVPLEGNEPPGNAAVFDAAVDAAVDQLEPFPERAFNDVDLIEQARLLIRPLRLDVRAEVNVPEAEVPGHNEPIFL